jgi:pyruvate decarboxylase
VFLSIGIAEDIAYTKVPVSSLDTKIMKSLPANDSTTEGQLIQDIQAKLEDSHSPVLIVDGGAARHSWESHVNDLVSALRIPTFVTVLGKGAVDESLPTFAGVYGGSGSWPDVIKLVETSDCVLWLANQPSDFNTCVLSNKLVSL